MFVMMNILSKSNLNERRLKRHRLPQGRLIDFFKRRFWMGESETNGIELLVRKISVLPDAGSLNRTRRKCSGYFLAE